MAGEVIPISGHPSQFRDDRCTATTAAGTRCRNRAARDNKCRVHLPAEQAARRERRQASPPPRPRMSARRGQLERMMEVVRARLAGEYEIDEFGFDPELTEKVLLEVARPFFRDWWRIDWIGLENVPAEGGALLVANHSGTVPFDAVMMKFGILDRHHAKRHVRLLAADLVFRMPFIGELARKSGNTLASEDDAYRLLADGELLGVFPEGFKGVGKHFRDRYKLQRFGRGGFIEVALRANVPIIPVSIVGAEEIYPLIAHAKPLARMFGLPYFPITPFFPWLGPLGLVPLPSKWIVEFGEPIQTDHLPEDAWQDGLTVFEMTDQVRDVIQQTLYKNLMTRRSVFT